MSSLAGRALGFANTPEPAVAATNKSHPWILNPTLDLLLCCGGLVWLLAGLAAVLEAAHGTSQDSLLLQAFTFAGISLTEMHVVGTLVRVYRTREISRHYHKYTFWAALWFGLLAIAGTLVPGLAGLLLRAYLLLNVQHFTSQTYGIGLLYCYKAGYNPDVWQKRSIQLLMNTAAAVAITGQLSNPDFSASSMFGQPIPFIGLLPDFWYTVSLEMFVFTAFVFLTLIVVRHLQDGRMMPLPAMLTIFTGAAAFALIGTHTASLLMLFVPAFYHSTQYLALTAVHHFKETGISEGVSAANVWELILGRAGANYFVGILGLTVTCYLVIPAMLSAGLHTNFQVAFASIFCCFSFHHFLTDRAIWKLRDPRLRKNLSVPA